MTLKEQEELFLKALSKHLNMRKSVEVLRTYLDLQHQVVLCSQLRKGSLPTKDFAENFRKKEKEEYEEGKTS